jgi:hypothetical protein
VKFRRVAWDMPFDVVFDVAYDQQRVLLEHSKLTGVGHADLFRDRFLARASRAVEQISSRLCALSSAIHPFFSSGMRLRFLCSLWWRFWPEFRCRIFLRDGEATPDDKATTVNESSEPVSSAPFGD